MTDYVVKPLDANTWDGFAGLAQRHNGVFGGCWCTFFHTMHSEKTFDSDDNRSLKRRLVEEGRAHAAQRDAHPLRAGGLHVRPQQGHGELRHAPHRALTHRGHRGRCVTFGDRTVAWDRSRG